MPEKEQPPVRAAASEINTAKHKSLTRSVVRNGLRGKGSRVKLWPVLGLRSRSGGAWRIWSLAHSFDRAGSGAILRAELRERLGLDPRKLRRWLRAAEEIGLLELKRSKRGPLVVLAGIERAAGLLGCESLGPRPVLIPVDLLIGPGWRAHVWAGYLASLGREGEVTISRAKLRGLTGIIERSQLRLERAAGVKARANYAVGEQDASEVCGEREFGRAHAFPWRDALSGERVIAWRLPDTRRAPGHIWRCANGRTRKVNAEIRGASLLKLRGDHRLLRIFRASLAAAERAARKLCQPDKPRPREEIRELYYPRFRARRATVWADLRI